MRFFTPLKTMALAFCLSTGAGLVAGDGLDMANGIVEINEGGSWIKTSDGLLLGGVSVGTKRKDVDKDLVIAVEPAVDFIDAGVSCLKVDTANALKEPSEKVLVRFYSAVSMPSIQEMAGKMATVEIWAKSSAEGAPCSLLIEGNTKSGAHFYQQKEFTASTKWTHLSLHVSSSIPKDIESIWVRFDCEAKSGYFLARPKITLDAVPQTTAVSSGNLIINGGAERGWDSVTTCFPENLLEADGAVHLWDGNVYRPPFAKWSIDDACAYSGKRSFKVDTNVSTGYGCLTFNPVPFEPGKPATFSVVLKASRPCTISLELHVASGIAYMKSVGVGTDWKVYTLSVPAWGKDAPGVAKINDVVNGYGCPPKLCYPHVAFPKNATLWVDNAAYSLADSAQYEESDLLLRGSLDRGSAAYQPGETVKMNFEIENASAAPMELETSFNVYDYFGRLHFSSKPETVKLGPSETVKEERPFVPDLLGPMNFIFSAKNLANGKESSLSLYLGVFERAKRLHPWFALDCAANQNAKVLCEYLKDFGIGSVRLWSTYDKKTGEMRGFEQLPVYKNAGLSVLMNINIEDQLVPLDAKPFAEYAAKFVKAHRGEVDYYEIMNEPNIWPAPKDNPDPAKFCAMSVDAYMNILPPIAKELKEADPAAKTAGPATCHTDVAWTACVLEKGASRYLDVVTEHPYRSRPEVPDYERDIQALQAAVKKCGRNLPIFATECGWVLPSAPDAAVMTGKVREPVSFAIRNQLIAYANGVARYVHFAASLNSNEGSFWNVLYMGSPAFPGSEVPNPYLYAIRIMQEHIDGTNPIGRIDTGSAFRCYVFEKNGRRVAALWKCQDEDRPSTVAFRSEPKDFKIFDIMGNQVEIKSRAFEVSPSPCYIETSMTFDELKSLFAAAEFTGVGAPFEMSVSVVGENSFAVKVENRVNKPISGRVEVFAEPGLLASKNRIDFEKVAPNDAAFAEFAVAEPIGVKGRNLKAKTILSDGVNFDVANFNLRALLCPKAEKPIKIDGDLSDWPQNSKPVVLDVSNAIKDGPAKWSSGDDAIKATLRTAWCSDGLYIAVEVEKPGYFPDTKVNGPGELWNGDSLQIAFDTLKDGKIAKGEEYMFDPDDFEYCIGQFKGETIVWRLRASSVSYDGFGKDIGLLKGEIEACIKQERGKTIYEMKFPPRSVSPFRLVDGNSMRWDIIVNLNDGEGRMGWLELTRGIGQCKSPGDFMDILLVDDGKKEAR